MKNTQNIITAILAVAVAILFYLQLSNKSKTSVVAAAPKTATLGKGVQIAYFDMDSIQNHYTYYLEVKKELETKEQSITNDLNKIKKDNQNKLIDYQTKFKDLGANGNVSEAEKSAAMAAQQDLQQRQADMQREEQRQAAAFSEESRNKLAKVKETIENFLKEYNKNGTYSFILVNSPDLIYYKDSSYNITSDLIKGLNEDYKAKKK